MRVTAQQRPLYILTPKITQLQQFQLDPVHWNQTWVTASSSGVLGFNTKAWLTSCGWTDATLKIRIMTCTSCLSCVQPSECSPPKMHSAKCCPFPTTLSHTHTHTLSLPFLFGQKHFADRGLCGLHLTLLLWHECKDTCQSCARPQWNNWNHHKLVNTLKWRLDKWKIYIYFIILHFEKL